MSTTLIEEKTQAFKLDIRDLQREVKRWEEEIRLKEIDRIAKACLENFNNLQMTIARKLKKNTKHRREFDLECHQETYAFLSYVDTKVDSVTFQLLDKKAKHFVSLLNAYSKYCSKVESEYNLALESEDLLKS